MHASPCRIAVLISGGGTTLKNLLAQPSGPAWPVEIVQIISSRCNVAGVQVAQQSGIPTAVVRRKDFLSDSDYSQAVFECCRQARVDWVVLGGFLCRLVIPQDFADRVVNIHPSLLPAFGGQGFHGEKVHQAVLAAGCRVSGCTVHFVDNHYDAGPIIAQACVPVLDHDTPELLAARVFQKECQLYPEVLRKLVAGSIRVDQGRVYTGD